MSERIPASAHPGRQFASGGGCATVQRNHCTPYSSIPLTSGPRAVQFARTPCSPAAPPCQDDTGLVAEFHRAVVLESQKHLPQ